MIMALMWGNILVGFAAFIAVFMVLVISFYSIILVISVFQLRKEYLLNRNQTFDEYMNESFAKPPSLYRHITKKRGLLPVYAPF